MQPFLPLFPIYNDLSYRCAKTIPCDATRPRCFLLVNNGLDTMANRISNFDSPSIRNGFTLRVGVICPHTGRVSRGTKIEMEMIPAQFSQNAYISAPPRVSNVGRPFFQVGNLGGCRLRRASNTFDPCWVPPGVTVESANVTRARAYIPSTVNR